MSERQERLPFPGLRSFTRDETDLFFGREGSVDAMIDRLAATRFLAVLGASGSGKSSLVRTGLLDGLELGLLHRAGSRWLIADFRPGDAPIANMAEGLLRAAQPDPAAAPPEDEIRLLRAFLARGPRSVVEWCEAGNLPEGANLLLLVDQFEELFRYSEYSEREEAEAFVALLLESARAPLEQARIYVAITMRSEFLGAAALIDGLAEAINRGLYLTPRMGRDQVREAIVGPAAVCGFSIEPALVNRLLNDLTSFAPWEEDDKGNQLERLVRRADQLPLMQHVLNRLWSLSAARDPSGPVVLRLEDYNALGGLRGALDAHGSEILDELLPEHREVAAAVFRALTAGSSLAEAVRRPTEFGELVAIAGGDEIAVREVVEAFRAPGRNFLVPPRPVPLRPTTVIDISHESLIRQWGQFARWLQEEIASAAAWRRLVDAAERFERSEANLLSGLALASLANWWDGEQPTAAWAKRYGGDYGRARDFLAGSRRAEEAGKDAEAEERRQKARNRMITWAAVLILCIIVPLSAFAGYSALRASREAEAARVERQAADAARQQALAAAATAEDERQRALAAQDEALQQAAAAETERQRADVEREHALQARQQAETERQRALEAAERAEAERVRADEERRRALAAQEEAELQAAAAAEAQRQAEAERQVSLELARKAETERLRAEEQTRIAERERNNRRLELVAGRAISLQQEGAWEAAANLLGALWGDLIEAGSQFQGSWLIEPVRASFGRQSLAQYPVLPDFLAYAGLDGWNGTSGRFRVFSVSPKADGPDGPSYLKEIAVFDAVTGAVTGRFTLPPGKDLGSKLDLVAPDGKRVAIITDAADVALWAEGQPAPTVVPVPAAEGRTVDVSQLAPVSTDGRFALYLTYDSEPGALIVVDPAAAAITFTIPVAELALAVGVDSITAVQLLGLSGGQLVLLVNEPEGRLITVGIATRVVRELDIGGAVKGAQLTPDGRIVLTLTCPGQCQEQRLVASELATQAALWVEKVPTGMTFVDRTARLAGTADAPAYSAAVENKGQAVIFEFAGDPVPPARSEGASRARMGEISFDGTGGYRSVAAASTDSSGSVAPVGSLANYRIPLARQKLSLYVAANSIAVHEDAESARIAGVDYLGNLLVYRRGRDGRFEEDLAFRPVQIGGSACLAAMAFSGDGRSLLVRHIDGSLQYVTAVGAGAGVGWRSPSSGAGDPAAVELQESNPATNCETPEAVEGAVTQQIVPVDRSGRIFAAIDAGGAVWWIRIQDSDPPSSETQPGRPAATALRDFAPLEQAATGMQWITGDPERGRIAAVAQPAGSAGTSGQAAAPGGDSKDAAIGGGRRDALSILVPRGRPGDPEDSAAGGSDRIPQRGEPKAAAFDPEGRLLVAYAGGALAVLADENGAWSVKTETAIPDMILSGLFMSGGRIAVIGDTDRVVGLDAASGAITGYGRLPANPSFIAPRPDGTVLSVEYDTDAVSDVALAALPAAADINDAARLVTMRSRREPVEDSSIEALRLERAMEGATPDQSRESLGCAEATALYLSALETRILGGAAVESTASPPDCAGTGGPALAEVAELLAARAAQSSISAIVRDEAFSLTLRNAAAGDGRAMRILGAVLARIATDRGEAEPTEITRDALRFGTGFAPAVLRGAASGAPIPTDYVDAARARGGFDPMAQQLIGHFYERGINDLASLREALVAFAIAERLYREGGRSDEARYAAQRRAHLARILPDEMVLDVWAELADWRPQADDAPAELPPLPADPAARRAEDSRSADLLSDRLPDSLLLGVIRTELARAEILSLVPSDPRGAVDRLLALGPPPGETGWSPDLVREYLGLADGLASGRDPESAFRLAAASLKLMGGAFRTPIHTQAEAVALFRRASELFADLAGNVAPDRLAGEAAGLDLAFAQYRYDLLPPLDAKGDSDAAEAVLAGAARVFGAVADHGGEPARWNRMRAEALFWQGVIVNNRDWAAAATLLRASSDLLRPLVVAAPDDLPTRFRYAEALRWTGLSMESTQATADVERESIRQYSELWAERSEMGADLLSAAGIGYGFALANLSQTLREMNLADLSDGRSAEEHAPWVLESLALAADKDELNAQMIEVGAATTDSDFVNGWYRMSSYGWGLGFLGGLARLEDGTENVTQCDVLAADPYDPGRRAPGLLQADMDAARAEAECRTARQADPQDPRATYQLARAMSTDSGRSAEFLPLATEAAEAGMSAGAVLVASTLETKSDAGSPQAYQAAAQLVVAESFPVLHPFLATHARSDLDRRGLDWFTAKAAALGVPEAHIALAEAATEDVTRAMHLRIAARLWDEAGDIAAAAEARRRADALGLTGEPAGAAARRVAEWTPEPRVEIPAESTGSM